MAASVQTLKRWLETAKQQQATHVIIVRDIYDQEDFPVYVSQNEDARKEAKLAETPRSKRVKHVFNLSEDLEEQLKLGTCIRY